MKKTNSLILSIIFLIQLKPVAQNISGIVNSYAKVTSISGMDISVSSGNAFSAGDKILLIQMKGASVDASNTSSFGNITAMGGAGTYEFLNVLSVSGNTISSATAPTHLYSTGFGFVQVVRVPKYCSPVVAGPLTCAQWTSSTGTGGVIALEAGTLTLNADITASAKGFNGGNFTVAGAFGCDNGSFAGAFGINGGQKGESISTYLVGKNGFKGKQANGGGGSNSGNSGGGGGGNAGSGGFGGHQYSGCNGLIDERGVGGLSLTPVTSSLFMGAGGGGGFEDNAMIASRGGNGGGIIYIRANVIISNNRVISANGGSVTVIADAEGAGGGGAGGTIFIECNNISGNLAVKTDGGTGGSNNNSIYYIDCHGTGGGGGGGVFAYSAASLPSGVVYSAVGGAAGIVNNPQSTCYNTTNGAADGGVGIALPGLPTTALALNELTLTVQPLNPGICAGESVSLTAAGAPNYHWSTGSTNTTIVVSPGGSATYTLRGSGPNFCDKSLPTSISVSLCTSISGVTGETEDLKFYPNPTTSKVFFETQRSVKLILSDGSGRKMCDYTFEKGACTLDLELYAPGIYFIREQTNSTKVMKVVKVQ